MHDAVRYVRHALRHTGAAYARCRRPVAHAPLASACSVLYALNGLYIAADTEPQRCERIGAPCIVVSRARYASTSTSCDATVSSARTRARPVLAPSVHDGVALQLRYRLKFEVTLFTEQRMHICTMR